MSGRYLRVEANSSDDSQLKDNDDGNRMPCCSLKYNVNILKKEKNKTPQLPPLQAMYINSESESQHALPSPLAAWKNNVKKGEDS